MQIKTIKIQGFKSFLQETELHLQPGITGIVGPNGSGKSNVVDALRWAIGEQSLKRIRAKTLDEILFNGSEEHPATGMARVSIVFSRGTHGFPEPFSELSELSLERIYYRSGESEYRINRMPVRLKDVLELFMDTGSGSKAYSIIEQGYIGEIVSASAEQRRVFFEEAAGIMKYKTRKNAALRKMEATRDNLRHIDAVAQEIHRQMNALNRQAQKAKKYRDVKEKIRSLECRLASLEYADIARLLRGETESRDGARAAEAALRTRIAQEEAEVEVLRLRTLENARRVEALQEKIGSLSQELNRIDNEQAYVTRSLEDLEKRADEEARAARLSEERLRSLAEEKKDLDREVGELLKRSKWLQEMRGDLSRQRLVYTAREEELRKSLEDQRTALFGCLTRLTEARNLEISAAERIEELGQRRTRGLEETARLSEEIARLETTRQGLEREKAALLKERAFAQMELSLYELYQEKLERQRKERSLELESLQETLHRKASRLQSLLELQQSYEGCQEGVKAIMLHVASGQQEQRKGILGMVADVLETSPEYETALESVLGERLQYIVTESQRDGLEAVNYLKSHMVGRSSFIPLHSRTPVHAEWAFTQEDDGLEALMRHVEVKEGYRDIAAYLLRDVFVVPDMDTALEVWEKNGASRTLVTKEGEMIDPYGVITGGKTNGSGSSMLRTRREVGLLEAEVRALEATRAEQQETLQKILWKARLAEADCEKLHRACYDMDLEILRREKDIQKIGELLRITADRRDIVRFEVEQFEREADAVREALASSSALRAELEQEKDARESSLASLTSRLDEFLVDKELHGEAWHDLEAELRRLDEEIRHKSVRLERVGSQLAELTSLHQDRGARIADLEDQKASLRTRREENAATIARLAQMRSEEETTLTGLRDVVRSEREALESKEASIRSARKELEGLLETIREKDLSIAALEVRRQGICERVREKYHIDLNTSGPEQHERTGGGLASLSQEEIKSALESAYKDLERLGEVNPNAIEEFEELSKRHAFYREQYEDLLRSLDSLQRLIQRINRLTKKRFLEAFECIRGHFQAIFPKLFGGGRASLELVDPENILETGVEIVAQPPGKRLQSVTLLSGGEKALTAIALIFAIFQYKPSPFCILDEVDAALDDVSIHRFNELVREMAGSSQFVLITHNKQTMEIAGTLFGVVMESPGVSKIVSVRME